MWGLRIALGRKCDREIKCGNSEQVGEFPRGQNTPPSGLAHYSRASKFFLECETPNRKYKQTNKKGVGHAEREVSEKGARRGSSTAHTALLPKLKLRSEGLLRKSIPVPFSCLLFPSAFRYCYFLFSVI